MVDYFIVTDQDKREDVMETYKMEKEQSIKDYKKYKTLYSPVVQKYKRTANIISS